MCYVVCVGGGDDIVGFVGFELVLCGWEFGGFFWCWCVICVVDIFDDGVGDCFDEGWVGFVVFGVEFELVWVFFYECGKIIKCVGKFGFGD